MASTALQTARREDYEAVESQDNGSAWEALLEKARVALAQGVEIRIPSTAVRPMPGQPRVYFSDDGIKRLSQSMKGIGQIVPGIVRRVQSEDGVEYELLDGERRWRAAKLADMLYRATLIEIDDTSVPFIIAAVANFNRESHTPTEISDSIHQMRKLKIPMEEIAKIIGITPHWAYQMHSLQKLEPMVRDMLDPNLPKEEKIPLTAAVHIAKADPSLQFQLAQRVLEKTLPLTILRSEVVRVSRDAGANIRERQREPRKVWELATSLVNQIRRTSNELENLLGQSGLPAIVRDRSPEQVELFITTLELGIGTIERCEEKIKAARAA